MDKLSKLLNKKRKHVFSNDDYLGANISLSTNQESEKSIEINTKIENNNILFKNNPNLRYKEDIIYDNDSIGFNDLFDIFSSNIDNKLYIISPNKISFSLDIYLLENTNQIVNSLKGHNNHITMVKYYFNSNDNIKKEYIISADINGVVIIWEINDINSYKKYEIKLKTTDFIYSCLMYFESINNYIITSTCGKDDTKLFILNDQNNIKFVKNIKNSKNNNVYYLLIWPNKISKEIHLIQFCKMKIVISNINSNEIYWNLIDEKNKDGPYMNGFIYSNKKNENEYYEYLYSVSMNGYINIWELHQKLLINSIFINNNFLNQIIQWNENYIIMTNGNKNNILIMDLNCGRIITSIFSKHEKGIINIKKVVHPIYGESLLSCGLEGSIFLWNV